MIGVFGKGTMQRDKVALCKKFIKRYILGKIKVGIFIHIVCYNFHTDSAAVFCHCGADFSRADNAGGFSVKIKSSQSHKAEIIFPDLYICLVYMTVDGKSQRQCVLGNRFGRVSGHSHNCYIILLCRGECYIVESRTPQKNEFYSAVGKNFYDILAYIRCHKHAYRIISFSKIYGVV